MGRLFGGAGTVFCPRFHICKKSEVRKPSEIFLAGGNLTSPGTPCHLAKLIHILDIIGVQCYA